jgi:hypothetical protein
LGFVRDAFAALDVAFCIDSLRLFVVGVRDMRVILRILEKYLQ